MNMNFSPQQKFLCYSAWHNAACYSIPASSVLAMVQLAVPVPAELVADTRIALIACKGMQTCHLSIKLVSLHSDLTC